MSIKITANFENVDFASNALSKVRKTNKGLKELRIKNRDNFDYQSPHTLAALAYYSQAPFDGVNYNPSSMIPNGALPIAFLENDNARADRYSNKRNPVTVEIETDNMSTDKICQQIRTNGGYDVKINK